jgi:hypothetical protein
MDFGSLGAHQRVEEGIGNERRGGLFIGKIHHQLPVGPADVGQPLHMSTSSCIVVQRVSRTSRYYPKGIQKVAYIRWSHVHPLVRFAGRTSNGPQRTSALQIVVYVRQT